MRPVPVLGAPWPGIPVRGRNAAGRADACWVPIARGLTPHGLRHTHKTLMDELGTPAKLADERMGHENGSVQARYSHITPGHAAAASRRPDRSVGGRADARAQLAAGSPVAVLDRLLVARRKAVGK